MEALTTVAFLDEIDGARDAAADRLGTALRLARTAGEPVAELRAHYSLASLHYYNGDVAASLPVLRTAMARVSESGLRWSDRGVELRLLNAVALYVAGDLEGSLRAAETAESPPPDVAAARLAAVSCYAAVAGGSPDAARRLARLRGSWDADPQVALVAGGCEADLLTWEGDPAGAVDVADRAQAPPGRGGRKGTYGGLWLSALGLAALADQAAACRGRRDDAGAAAAVRRGDVLRERVERLVAGGHGRPGDLGPEGHAWHARALAEHARLGGGPAVEEWQRALDAFGYGHAHEQARCHWRLSAALVHAGDRDAARTHARAAAAAAERMRAVPLQRAVAATVSRERLAAPQSAVDAVLTEREREVLALVAEGLTNREIGSRLFISAEDGERAPEQPHGEAQRLQPDRGGHRRPAARPAGRALTRGLGGRRPPPTPRPDWANASCAGPVLRPRVEDVPIRTVRRRQEETTCTRQARASDSRARCQGRFSTAATRLPPPRRPGSTRRSPTARRWSSRPRAPATSRPPCGTPPRWGAGSPSRPPATERRTPSTARCSSRPRGCKGCGSTRSPGRARVEAGVRWRSVIDAAVPHGLAPLSGSSSGVGVVGYTLGGGMGHLARRHGFAADHVRAVELVAADGELRRVTAESDPELFWAVRGGQGRFGIATAVEFDLVPLPEFFGGAMVFGARRGRARAARLRRVGADAARGGHHVGRAAAAAPARGGAATAAWGGQPGPALRLRRACGRGPRTLLAPMRRVATPLLDSVGPMSYAAVDGIHMDPTEPMPAVMRGGLLHSMPDELVDTLLAVAGPDVEVPLAMVELRLMGGALGRPAEVPNAVAGREGAFSLSVVAPAPPPLVATAHAVTGGVLRALEPWSPGTTLVNFAGHGSDQAPGRAWAPDVLERLRRVKATVDPDDVFGGALGAALVPAGAR